MARAKIMENRGDRNNKVCEELKMKKCLVIGDREPSFKSLILRYPVPKSYNTSLCQRLRLPMTLA